MSSEREMNKAYWQFAGATLDSAAFASFRAGRNAAMKFMSSPRIPALTPAPVHPEPDQVAERFVEPKEHKPWGRHRLVPCAACGGFTCDPRAGVCYSTGPFLPKEHTPIPLVAFYTDGPNV